MEYNFREVGERLRRERKKRKWSQEDFIGELKDRYDLSIARNRLSAIENGIEEAFGLEILLAACKLYDVDMGYLLGEYQETTKNVHDISEYTGLTEKAITALHRWKDGENFEHGKIKIKMPQNPEYLKNISVLSALIENRNGNIVLSSIYNYLFSNFDGFSVPDSESSEHRYIGNTIGICENEKTIYDVDASQLSSMFLTDVQQGLVRLKDRRKGNKNG